MSTAYNLTIVSYALVIANGTYPDKDSSSSVKTAASDYRIIGLSDYFQIIARMLPKLVYNPRIRGYVLYTSNPGAESVTHFASELRGV